MGINLQITQKGFVFMKNKSVSLVFWVSLVICTIFVAFGAIFPKQLEKLTQNITTFIALHFAWYYYCSF